MAKYLSYDHAINVVRSLYEEQGFNTHGRTPGKAVTKEFGHSIEGAKLGALFAIIDEFIFILRYQNYYLSGCLFNADNSHCVTNLRFCTGMLSTLCSIRALSGLGLDLNARAQLRFYYELSLLWTRIQLDDEARAAFESTKFEDTNQYWHSYISRQKCERFLFSQREGDSRHDWPGRVFKDHVDDIYTKLSFSAHPSFIGLYMNTIDDFHCFKDTTIGRGPDHASIFTLTSAILLSILPMTIDNVTDWKYQSPGLFDPSKIYPPWKSEETWSEYCKQLRKMMLGIALFGFRFSTELNGGKW